MFKGTIIAQIIAVTTSVYLAKIYGAALYGVYGTFLSFATIFSVINTLQLENNIVISKIEENSYNWFRFLSRLIPTISILTFILVCVAKFSKFTTSFNLILFAILLAVFLSLNKVYEALFTFKRTFNYIANAKIIFTLFNVLLQFILYSFYKEIGLISGFFIASIVVLFYYFLKEKTIFKPFNTPSIKKDLKYNSSIIKYLLPSNVINSLAIHLLPILIYAFFSAKEAGEYFFCLKILGAPLMLISNSVAQVYYQKSADLYYSDKAKLYTITKNVVLINIGIMFLFILFLNTIGMYFLLYFFKTEWNNLSWFVFLLSFIILARASFNPISNLMIVLNKNYLGLLFNIYLLIVNLISVFIGYTYTDISLTIIISVVFGSLGYISLLIYFLIYLRQFRNEK